jgi:AAA+ ATPase superfamily predicted ATPase
MGENDFIGREQELGALRREMDRSRASLIVVLGRRRVGKSTLLLEATRERQTIYYQATRVAPSMNLSLFKTEVARVLGADPLLDSLADWQGVLAYLEGAANERAPGLVIVLDEFPYLCDGDPALPSVLQKFWDGIRTRRTPLNLVLCGSKISFMDELLAEKNPLHGRQTLKLDLGPLPYRDAARFFPGWSLEDRLYAYAIFGGIPYYLNLANPGASLEENVLDLVLAKGAPLSDEPNNLLQAELRDVTRYATILRAVAEGCTTSGEIIGRVREIPDASALAPYVQRLSELRLLRIVRSLDATERERDRRYYLDDPFLAFWFRFYLPNSSSLAAGHGEQVYALAIAPRLDDYMGDLFEWICRDHARLYLQEHLPTPAQVVGQLWAASYDIDVAGTLLDGTALYGECKWWKDPVGENVLDALLERSRTTGFGRDADRRAYLMYSRAGFTAGTRARAKADPSIHLFTPAELLDAT